ncbi:glycosyltransferase [Vibrio cyclitrophicus]
MHKDITVSVAMTTYNAELYVEKQLDSIINQLHCNLEIIIVDDNSSDSTRNILEKYRKKQPNVHLYFNEANLGCTKSFEKAISLTSGDYIALCDHDDIWVPEKISVLLDEVKGCSLVYSDAYIIDGDGVIDNDKRSYKSFNTLFGMDSSVRDFHQFCYFNSFILGCSTMFDAKLKKYLNEIPNEGYNHDKWIVNVAARAGRVKYVDRKLLYYRVHGGTSLLLKTML